MIPSGPLRVNVSRQGGLLGRSVESHAVATPSSPAHDAAVALLGIEAPAAPPTRTRDGFTYAVTITDDDGAELLHGRFTDPVPDELGALLAALPRDPPPATPRR